MKKIVKCILAGMSLLMFANAFANSGPVYWQGYPSSNIMSVKENSSIEVLNENLVFDFSDDYDASHTISSKVTATYEMFNPESETQSVTMAFPIVERIDNFSSDDVLITADDSKLYYDVYIGDVVNSYGNPFREEKDANYDFTQIISAINDNLYKAENFEENEIGKLYSITVEPKTDPKKVNFAIDFSFDPEDTKFITKGFNRYEREEDKVRIASWCYDEPETLEIFVLGKDIDMNIKAYTDGALTEQTDLFSYKINIKEIDVKSYLLDYVKNYEFMNIKINDFSDVQLYNLYAETLDKYLTKNIGCSSEHDLMAEGNYERILVLVYTVEFPENSSKEVSVSYKSSGTMDMRETKKPKYTFDYILNPAKNWSSFKNLNIKVITPDEAPYIIKSSIDLKKADDNIYSATLSELPENDLSFTLYYKEQISFTDKAEGFIDKKLGYLAFFAPIFIGIIVIIVIMITVLKHRSS